MEENNLLNEITDDSSAQDTTTQQPDNLSTSLQRQMSSWTQKIETLNEAMKNLPSVDHLINTVYTERQNAVDTYYKTLGFYKNQIRAYKVKYAAMYNQLKMGSNGIRYSSDSAIQTQIEAAMTDHQEIIDELKTFTEFMWETVKTIDGIQYAISTKVKIYELMNGIKF